eukprot:1325208-Amphidinium_carterae.1
MKLCCAFEPHHAQALLCSVQLNELARKFLEAKDMTALGALQSTYKKAAEQVKLLEKSVKVSANRLKSHVENAARKLQREEAKRKRQKEQEELKQVRASAKAAAKKVQADGVQTPPLFQHSVAELVRKGIAKQLVETGKHIMAGIKRVVCLVTGRRSSGHCYPLHPERERRLQEVARRAKAWARAARRYGKDWRAQHPIYPAEGKEESVVLATNMQSLPADAVPTAIPQELEKVMGRQTQWLFGYHPSLTLVAPTPNGMAMTKSLLIGELKILLVATESLINVMQEAFKKDAFTLDAVQDFLAGLESA